MKTQCVFCNGDGFVLDTQDDAERAYIGQKANRDRLDRYVCAALTGLLLRNVDGDEKDYARWAVEYAKAALEAADKEGG